MKTGKVNTTKLTPAETLPLTCSRAGTCCHGKAVWLNPWELARLAHAKEQTPRAFRDTYCEFGGIRLHFNGPIGWKDLPACSQYIQDFGCSVHEGRPLACRLYPLGRQRSGETVQYIYEGNKFPCLEGCPEVIDLPHMSVADYIADQKAELCEIGQDEYLELMEQLADGAFALLLESGLAESGDRLTLQLWREMGQEDPEQLTERLGAEWIDRLMLPELSGGLDDPKSFCSRHYEVLQEQAQSSFGTLGDVAALRDASGLMMGLALHLGRGLGAQPVELAEHWINTAKDHGALD